MVVDVLEKKDILKFLRNNKDFFKKNVDVVYYDSVHPFLMQFIEEDLVYA